MTDTDNAPEGAIEPKTKLSGKIVKTTIGGAIVDIGQDVPGVIHISQLSKDAINRVEDVVQVGQTVEVWVRRRRDDRVELTMIEPLGLEWGELKADMVIQGKVTRIETYGVFVEIGAERPGLVHVSEISHDYIKSPADVLKEGEEVEVKILNVDRRKKQIRLSIKATMQKPEEIMAEAKVEFKKARGKKGKKEDYTAVDETPSAPEPTAMEIAWQEALAKADTSKGQKTKRSRAGTSTEQEEILNRTLEHRIPTG